MARSFDFAVVKIVPDPLRDEALNAAVVVLLPDGLEVHVTPYPERLRAIAPAFTSEVLDHLASALKNVDQKGASTADRLGILQRLPGVLISEPGTLQSENDAELRSHVSGLVNRLLSPVRLPLQGRGGGNDTHSGWWADSARDRVAEILRRAQWLER